MSDAAERLDELERAIELYGGPGEMARRVGRSAANVNNWRQRGDLVPPDICLIMKGDFPELSLERLRRDVDWPRVVAGATGVARDEAAA